MTGRSLMGWCLWAILVGAVGAAASMPRAVNPEAARTQVGGCGSGRCSSGSLYACSEIGDGCNSYQMCDGTTGDYFCTPQKYCTNAGCSPIDGAVCK